MHRYDCLCHDIHMYMYIIRMLCLCACVCVGVSVTPIKHCMLEFCV